MPQIAPIVVSFPVEMGVDIARVTTLDPLGTKDGLTSYAGGDLVTNAITSDVISPMPTSAATQSTLTISLHRPSKTSRISKVRVKLVVPVAVLDALGKPTAVKSHENSADVTYLFSEKSTLQERTDLDLLFQELITSSPAAVVIQELKSMY